MTPIEEGGTVKRKLGRGLTQPERGAMACACGEVDRGARRVGGPVPALPASVADDAGHGIRSRREAIEVHLRRLADGLALSIHDLWAHTMNDKYYVEIDLETDGALSLQQAHGLASSFETRALAEIPDLAELTTHIEPRGQLMEAVDLDVEQGRIAATVRQVVNATTGGDTCHQLQVHRGAAGWAVSFHCRLPGDTPLSQAHSFSTRLESDLRARVPGLERVLIHTEPRQGQ